MKEVALTIGQWYPMFMLSHRQGPVDYRALMPEPAQEAHLRLHGWTSLHLAALFHPPALLEMYLSERATPDVRNTRGATPLHVACQFFNPDKIELLLNAGADPHLEDSDGYDAFARASSVTWRTHSPVRHCERVETLRRLHADAIVRSLARDCAPQATLTTVRPRLRA